MATNTYTSSVNLGGFEIFNNKLIEKFPPNSPFASLSKRPDVQTTPQLARGYLPGSSIELLNNNLTHVCDFKFIFDIQGNFGLGLLSPVDALQKAIKNAKLKAANRLRSLVQNGVQAFRKAIDAIISVLGFDPSGEISYYWSLGKDLVRKANEIIEFIAEQVEIVLEWVFLAQQIKELVEWVLSLPDKLKALLADCIKNFTNSIQQVATSIGSIPEQIASLTEAQTQSIANEFTQASNLLLTSVTESQTNSDIPPAVSMALSKGTTDPEHIGLINNYIIDSTPSADSLTSNTTSYQFSTSQSP
jgi:hypothetical protein